MKVAISTLFVASVLVVVLTGFAPAPRAGINTSTPPELVASYQSLADAILAVKKTEADLVRAILAATYRHAEGMLAQAQAKLKANQPAKEEIEGLASLVSQLGNEGDSAIAGVRKRLLEGGHHHNAAGEQQGVFDEGFVIVTKASKKVFLDAAGGIGKMAQSPNADALNAEWQKVAAEWQKLAKPAK